MIVQTEIDLSRPEVIRRDLSQFIIKPVTEDSLFKQRVLWFLFIEKMFIFLSYEPVAMCVPSWRSIILVTAAS
jgi:hypothetical protein